LQFVIDLSTRRVEIAGITPEPDSAWMTQVSRNVTDANDGFLMGKRFLIHDRDPLFTVAFRETLAAADVQVVRLPPHSPNLNAHAERFVRTIKESCLDRMILVGEPSLQRAVTEFIEHYHRERNHQGLGNRLIVPIAVQTKDARAPVCRERLAGLLKYYHRPAASQRRSRTSSTTAAVSIHGFPPILRKARTDRLVPHPFPIIDSPRLRSLGTRKPPLVPTLETPSAQAPER
jgi:transposase InsO family protein